MPELLQYLTHPISNLGVSVFLDIPPEMATRKLEQKLPYL